MRMTKDEMRFFQDVYFLGARIRYIDESRHSPCKYAIEYHDSRKIVAYNSTKNETEILTLARKFLNEHSFTARHSQTAFFILRLATIKICFVFE